MRVVAGQDVEPARVGQLAVRATGGVAEEVEHVGLLGPERVGRGHAHEYAEAPALRNGVPVFDQRARQRQGLGRGLAPPQRVAGADQLLQAPGQVCAHGARSQSKRSGSFALKRRIASWW